MVEHHIDCYAVYESYDRDSRHVAYFSTEGMAKKYIEASKNKAYLSVQRHKKNYVIFENPYEVEQFSKAALRTSALAKLTALEKEALGIKD